MIWLGSDPWTLKGTTLELHSSIRGSWYVVDSERPGKALTDPLSLDDAQRYAVALAKKRRARKKGK